MRNKNNLQGVRSIVSHIYLRVARLIRSHKIIAITFVLALIVIVVFAAKSTNSVHICQKQTSIRFLDESDKNGFPGRSMTNSQTSSLKNYVTTISKYTFAKIDEIWQCCGESKIDAEVELIFIYRPLFANGVAPFNFEQSTSNNTRQLDSPWVKLMISKSPKLIVRATFIWNERQFILDQAVMLDPSAAHTKPPMPIDPKIFGQFVQSYTKAVLLSPSQKAEDFAQMSLSKQIPVDIMWLLRHSWQTTLGPFGGFVMSALNETIEQRTEQYIEMTKSLLDRRFASIETEQRYQSVLDLKDVFSIHTYKINRLH